MPAAAPTSTRLTRATAATQPKVSAAAAFLGSEPLDADSEEDDDDFDPAQDESYSDDEPEAVITADEVNFDALKAKMSSAAKRAQPTPLEPAEQAVFERRAAELESEYEAALAVAAARNRSSRPSSPAPSSSFSANSDGDEIVEGGPAVTEVTHKVDTLTLDASS